MACKGSGVRVPSAPLRSAGHRQWLVLGTVRVVTAKRGIFVAPFDELVDPNTLAALAASAEAHGWDGFFVWDHIRYRPPVRAVADAWVALAAVAVATDRIRLGPLVTPLARRRAHKLA